jgi:putative transposase
LICARRPRFATGGYVYHVLNRGVGRARIFEKAQDYAAFLRVLREAHDWLPVRLLAYCLLPNHWHLVAWPQKDGELSEWMRWLTVTHTQHWHAHYHSAGTGPVYQGRFKSFPVQEDDHLLTLLRYVERNPLRAGLVSRAEAWAWSSLGQAQADEENPVLASGPVARPAGWTKQVNEPQTEAEVQAIHECVVRGRPFGNESWAQKTARRLGLGSTLRPRGRPLKQRKGSPKQ